MPLPQRATACLSCCTAVAVRVRYEVHCIQTITVRIYCGARFHTKLPVTHNCQLFRELRRSMKVQAFSFRSVFGRGLLRVYEQALIPLGRTDSRVHDGGIASPSCVASAVDILKVTTSTSSGWCLWMSRVQQLGWGICNMYPVPTAGYFERPYCLRHRQGVLVLCSIEIVPKSSNIWVKR